jgi:hypothetical protein
MNTPTQKALIQLAESLVITALIAALIAIGPVLLATGPIDWTHALLAFVIAFVFSVAHGGAAYLKAYNVPLATVLDADISAVEQKIEPLAVQTTTTAVVNTASPATASVNTNNPLQGVGGGK